MATKQSFVSLLHGNPVPVCGAMLSLMPGNQRRTDWVTGEKKSAGDIASHLIKGAQFVFHKVVAGARVPVLQLLQHITLGLTGLCCRKDPVSREIQLGLVPHQSFSKSSLQQKQKGLSCYPRQCSDAIIALMHVGKALLSHSKQNSLRMLWTYMYDHNCLATDLPSGWYSG